MATVFLHGTFAGNRGDILMHDAAISALTKLGHIPTEHAGNAEVIADCCGYWCGDPWGPWKSEEMAAKCEEWKKQGKIVILLPQTFGPFENERILEAAKRIVDAMDVICARDKQSQEYLTAIAGDRTSIVQFPDYTIDVKPIPSSVFLPHEKSVAIIPNLRMIDKTEPQESMLYMPFLGKVIALLLDAGTDPFLLIHEEKDALMADALRQEYTDLKVVLEPDAQKTKWIIGQSHAVVSSRYHGILNALYQDVPVLATGWCHKFPALMEEWGIPEQLIDVPGEDDVLREKLTRLINHADRSNASTLVMHREKTAKLWRTVDEVMRSTATLGA